MNPVFRNILAVVAGWIAGGLINMGLVQTGYLVFPLEGVNMNDMDALIAAMPGLGPKYFIFPFLAHAIGTSSGAVLAALFAATHKMKMALIVGVLFLIGGIIASFMFPAPIWFILADITLAYIPMAWLGGMLGSGRKRKTASL